MPSKSVIVVGGGLAGLSSAVALAEAGFRVCVLEKRPHLGGRASSYLLPSGEHVDNCQHVTMGCCTNLEDFYRRVGVADKIYSFDRLVFADAHGRRGIIEASPLAPPFHLVPSFALFPLLTWADKRVIARAMLTILSSRGRPGDAGGATMLDWLCGHGQTPGSIERFWRVVLVSALDEELGRIEAAYGVDVFWKAFLANRTGFQLGIPSVPLSQLYAGCCPAIERRGGEVRTRTAVREICVAEERVSSVRLNDGQQLTADYYVAAVPHEVLPALLPPEVVKHEPLFANLRCLRSSPITGVHFWLDREVMTEPFVTLLGGTVQWVFNKSLLLGESADSGQYLQLVISASYDLLPRSRPEIIEICRRDLMDVFPGARDARLVKATVIKETSATFSPEPGCDRWRPGQMSPLRNLFLAGDWTATGWPATMEGAVRSGYLAAQRILDCAGNPRNLLRPDLPIAWMTRWLSGWDQRSAATAMV